MVSKNRVGKKHRKKMVWRVPRAPQEHPKSAQERPKSAQERTKSAFKRPSEVKTPLAPRNLDLFGPLCFSSCVARSSPLGSLGNFSACWEPLGRSWERLGSLLERLWALLEPSGEVLEEPWGPLGSHLIRFLKNFWMICVFCITSFRWAKACDVGWSIL